ncbi:hypothetical protein D9756_010605 [Leucocoprinus leucothites]|uniref:Protein kinase domain-containing protein n=1 Tax=Leucocoprinus leucothites TaxID=201217 RepID=A0A8H5CRW8_9AGAR|nr:hypothetical protein D9756_010605 [Leucoagaricus leucothites]
MPSLRHIAENEILLLDVIGFGGFADVHSGLWVSGDREGKGKLAVKVFRQVKTENDALTLQTLNRRLHAEISAWLLVQPHPNILPFIGAYHHDSERLPALVSPLREAGDVLSYLSRNTFSCRSLALGIVNGLAHLHAHNIVHGDLKPKNVLIHIDNEGKPTPEISDFGRAKILDIKGYTGSLHMTRRYAAPEVLNPAHTPDSPVVEVPRERANEVLTKASDVWSLGMVLLHVLSGREPYPGLNENQIVLALVNGQEPKEEDHPKMITCPVRARAWTILKCCWKLKDGPEARWSAKECANELKIPLEGHTYYNLWAE